MEQDFSDRGREESKSLLPISSPSTQVDSRYAWVVCMSCFFIHVICDGVGMSFGVLVPYIMKNLGASHAKAAFIGSLHIGTSYMTAPFNTTLAEMVGYRKMSLIGSTVATLALAACSLGNTLLVLTMSYGLLAGIGICMVLSTSELIVNQYFDKRRALANGIVFSGTSIGCFISAPIFSYVLDKHGLEATFLVEAGVTSVCFLLGLLLKNPTHVKETSIDYTENKTAHDKVKDFFCTMFDKRVVSNTGFVFYAFGRVLNFSALMVPLLYIPSLALKMENENVTLVQTSFALTILGVCNLIGRLMCGVLDRFPGQVITVNAVASLLSGLVVAHCQSLHTLYAASGAYGLVIGPIVALSPSILVQLVGTEAFSSALGLHMFIYGVATFAGPPVIGIMIDHYKNYTCPFYIAATCYGVGFVFHMMSKHFISSTFSHK